ncbi:MAG: Uma2 family endonuclease [Tepidisphaeraceae bacterium]
MSAAKKLGLISVPDYLAGELVSKEKHEFVAGRVYAMAGGRNSHNALGVAFVSLVHAQLRGKPCQPFNSDTKVRVSMPTHTRFYYPDGMIVCEPNPGGDTFQDRPAVIAEVMSVSTRRLDEGEKREAYLSIPTLQSYLLIETTEPRVTAFERTNEGFVEHVYEGMDAVIPLLKNEVMLPLAELYERIDFPAAQKEAADEWHEIEFGRQ